MTITITGIQGEGKSLAAAIIIDALQNAGCAVQHAVGKLPLDVESAADVLRSLKPEIVVVERTR